MKQDLTVNTNIYDANLTPYTNTRKNLKIVVDSLES